MIFVKLNYGSILHGSEALLHQLTNFLRSINTAYIIIYFVDMVSAK